MKRRSACRRASRPSADETASGTRPVSRRRAAFLAVVMMLIAGLTAGFFTNLAVTAKVDGTCDLGLCGFGGFSPYMLLTFWLPFAFAAALTLGWLWWAGRPRSN